jgi:hypothetical protein
LKAVVAAVLLSAAAMVVPAPANAAMLLGNYDLLTNRYTQASWVWFVAQCIPEKSAECVDVHGIPRLKFYAYYQSKAYLVDGRYSFTVDVNDGLRCLPGYSMPTRDTYSWDAVSLVGTIDSVYDVGCFNGPPGKQFWTFKLQRL